MPRAATILPEAIPAYVGEDDLRTLVCPGMGAARFRALVTQLEPLGFPRVDPLFRARYWPAVKAWLDARHGLGHKGQIAAIDGEENFNAPEKRNTRPHPSQAQERERALLERSQPLGRGDAISRSVDPFTARRNAGRAGRSLRDIHGPA